MVLESMLGNGWMDGGNGDGRGFFQTKSNGRVGTCLVESYTRQAKHTRNSTFSIKRVCLRECVPPVVFFLLLTGYISWLTSLAQFPLLSVCVQHKKPTAL